MLYWDEFMQVLSVRDHVEVIIYVLECLNEGLSINEFHWSSIVEWFNITQKVEKNRQILKYACEEIVADNQYYVNSDLYRQNPQFCEEVFDRTVILSKEMDRSLSYAGDTEGKFSDLIRDFQTIFDLCNLIRSWVINPDN